LTQKRAGQRWLARLFHECHAVRSLAVLAIASTRAIWEIEANTATAMVALRSFRFF